MAPDVRPRSIPPPEGAKLSSRSATDRIDAPAGPPPSRTIPEEMRCPASAATIRDEWMRHQVALPATVRLRRVWVRPCWAAR